MSGFKGFVGYVIRELDQNETSSYCISGTTSSTSFPFSQNRVNFTCDFMVRSYTSGCYFYDTSTGKWSSYGMHIHNDTDLQKTHCSATHLTTFAGGLVVAPSIINFQYAISSPSLTKNVIIYVIVIVITSLYIVFAICARCMDSKDKRKLGVILLKDNYPDENYYYELLVFTGNRSESGTHSKVFINASILLVTLEIQDFEIFFLKIISRNKCYKVIKHTHCQ